MLTKVLTSLANLGHVVTSQAGEVGPCSAWLTWDNMSMTLISKIYQVCHRWIHSYKIHLKVSPSFSLTSSKSILLVQMFIGLTRSVAMIFGSADPSASIPISVGPATCTKRSMPHFYSSRVWFSRKKLTWSIPHLPKSCRLASATNLFPGPTARYFAL